MRLFVIAALALALALSACRASVDGAWEGRVGDDGADMVLEQEGALVTGRICIADACDELDGDLVEERLEAWFGCAGCALPATTLELDVRGAVLEGRAILDRCDCDEDGCCRLDARFTPQR